MRVGIIGAMDEEVVLLKKSIKDLEMREKAGCVFYIGKIETCDVVLLQSGIGKVNAAMATTLLINDYQPDVIINTGSAGGFNTELSVGDLVISTEVVHHDADSTAFDYALGQVPGMPATFKADPMLIAIAEQVADRMDDEIKVIKGLIATGDSFLSDPDTVMTIKSHFPELQCGEMEAASIAQVSYRFNVPFVIIRSLSDIAGRNADITFDQFLETAAAHSANLILLMLKKL